MSDKKSSPSIQLTSRVALLDRVELCVVGGGLAGVAAALTAAEAGIETALVEERGALSWEISHGLEIYLSGAKSPPALVRICETLAKQNATRNGVLDPVATEVLCDKLLTAANVRLHFRAFAGAYDSGLVRLTTKSGPLAIQASAVVDATEESRLARRSRIEARAGESRSRAFLLCAVTPPAAAESIAVDGVSEAVVRPTLWPNEAHVQITWKSASPEKQDSESRFAIARTIETLRKTKPGFENANLSLSAHESFALNVPKLEVAENSEKIFVAGPALLGRKPTLEERAELGERAAAQVIEELRGVAAR